MDKFTENINNIYGDVGKDWLNNLSELLQKSCSLWDLEVISSCKHLTYNYVAYVKSYSSEAVIKLVCDKQQFLQEVNSLKILQNANCIRLLNYSHEYQAILLSKAEYSLEKYFPERENESVDIYANLIKNLMNLSLVKDKTIPHVEQLLLSIKNNSTINSDFISKSLAYIDQFIMKNIYILHGDLHQGNILKFEDSWVMIDPKCVIGPIEYEIAAFIINPKDLLKSNLYEIISFRIASLSNTLNLNKVILTKWVFVRCILAACWCVEDNMTPDNFINIANCVDLILSQ